MRDYHIARTHKILVQGIACDADSVLISGDGLLINARIGNDVWLSPSLFGGDFSSPWSVGELENYLMWTFGKIRSLASISAELFAGYRSIASPFLRKTPQSGCDAVELAQGLCLAVREFAVPGYYPGMWHLDRNSAHPACCVGLCLPYAYFMSIKKEPSGAMLDVLLRQEGFGSFRVVCGRDIITGALPVREPKGIDYPHCAGDIFGGVWTLNEVRYALECGYRILDCSWIVSSRFGGTFLEQFMLDAYERRLECKERGDLMGVNVWKQVANKLVGRLGMGNDSPPSELRRDPNGVVRMFGTTWSRTNRVFKSRANRLASAYVFAEQRIAMHKALVSAEQPVYAFCDSIVCRGLPDVAVGSGLGEWKMVQSAPLPYEIIAKGKYRSVWRVASRGVKGGLRGLQG